MRVLFTCCPAYGHLHPMLPLATALASEGHEVAFATGEEFVERATAAGFTGFACGTGLDRWGAELARRVGGPPGAGVPIDRIMEYWLPRLFVEVGAALTAEDLVPLARTWQPHLIIHESSEFAGPLAAAVIGVPSVQHSLGPLYTPEVMALAGRSAEPLWRRWGLEPQPQGGMLATVCLCLAPAALETPNACAEEKRWPLRSLPFDSTSADEAPEWMRDLGAKPVVHATLGTAATNQNQDILRTVIDGLSGRPLTLVVTVGRNNDPAAFDPLPENVRVERYIPHSLLLQRCDVVITHGGAGTMFGALNHGLPQLFLPQGADQYINAERCVASGCARSLAPDEVSPAAVAAEVTRLVEDQRYRDAARRLRVEMEAMPGPAEVARRLSRAYLE